MMSHQKIFSYAGKFTIAGLLVLAACNLPGSSTLEAPTFDPTKAALEFQATLMSQQLTVQAVTPQPPILPTATLLPPEQPTSAPPTAIVPAASDTSVPATATQDVAARMKTAKILLYEDTPYIGLYIKNTLDGMGLKYTMVGDALGNFMENLNSGIPWDLVIVGAESHDYVSGDFFDILTKDVVQNKTALIVEMWYLDLIHQGRIQPLLTQCGVAFQKSYDAASSIYWLESSAPVFTEPKIAVPLIHYSIYWQWQAGDYMRLRPGSDATLLAGMFQNRNSDYGVIASCFDGRVILQTFCNHDYKESDIQLLWQNYIYNTLKNHFAALAQ